MYNCLQNKIAPILENVNPCSKDHKTSGDNALVTNVSSVFSILHESLQAGAEPAARGDVGRGMFQERSANRAVTGKRDVLILAPTAGGKIGSGADPHHG